MLDSQNNPTPNHWGIACPFIVVGSGENAEKNFFVLHVRSALNLPRLIYKTNKTTVKKKDLFV